MFFPTKLALKIRSSSRGRSLWHPLFSLWQHLALARCSGTQLTLQNQLTWVGAGKSWASPSLFWIMWFYSDRLQIAPLLPKSKTQRLNQLAHLELSRFGLSPKQLWFYDRWWIASFVVYFSWRKMFSCKCSLPASTWSMTLTLPSKWVCLGGIPVYPIFSHTQKPDIAG